MMGSKKGGDGALDLMKKLVSSGLGAALMTEDIVRGLVSDIPMPKELLDKLLLNAKSSKEELVDKGAKILGELIQRVNWHNELDRLLNDYDVEIRAHFRLRKRKKQQ